MNNINKAIEFATLAHKEQLRKGTQIPYIVHLFEVGVILAQNNASENVIIAGILHDTVEDTATTLEDITINFGDEIAKLVAKNSENKALSWEERKQHTINDLKNETQNVKLIACADKLSNIRGIEKDFVKLGDKVWDRFNRGKEQQKWYYGGLVESLKDLANLSMYQELKATVYRVFN